MELPMNVLVVLAIVLIVLIAVIVGVINPARLGLFSVSNATDSTLVCNEWGAKKCGSGFFDLNRDRIESTLRCEDFDTCKGNCTARGLC